MRILQVNKFLYPAGGAETVMFQTADLLQRRGHEVFFFGMDDDRNVVAADAGALVSSVNLRERRTKRDLLRPSEWGNAARIVRSAEAARKMERYLDVLRPDVVHLHNIYHQLSPSILPPLRRRGIPTVLTLHDYKLVCPNYMLYAQGAVCERCRGHRYYQAFLQSCVKDSRLQSMLCSFEAYVHQALGGYDRNVDRYVAPSRFMSDKMVAFGMDASRIDYLPNFLNVDEFECGQSSEKYFVYAGRVEAVKGVQTLIQAVSEPPISGDVELRIAGDGALRASLEEHCRIAGRHYVRFLGHLSREEVGRLVRGAMFVVLPSEWYENAPMSILEAYAYGKPVIASRMGGIPEMVDEGVTGLLFEPGNAADLRSRIDLLVGDPALAAEMGRQARKVAEAAYGPDDHYARLMDIYGRAGARSAESEAGRTA
ncbi:MAG TPA: glycosyltransferase [Dehalococcoidia bacterium]|nr:glycosyltransferase [Dehalococcoidia bacterium]